MLSVLAASIGGIFILNRYYTRCRRKRKHISHSQLHIGSLCVCGSGNHCIAHRHASIVRQTQRKYMYSTLVWERDEYRIVIGGIASNFQGHVMVYFCIYMHLHTYSMIFCRHWEIVVPTLQSKSVKTRILILRFHMFC